MVWYFNLNDFQVFAAYIYSLNIISWEIYLLNCSDIGEQNLEKDEKEFDGSGELGEFDEENEEEVNYEDIDVNVILTK